MHIYFCVFRYDLQRRDALLICHFILQVISLWLYIAKRWLYKQVSSKFQYMMTFSFPMVPTAFLGSTELLPPTPSLLLGVEEGANCLLWIRLCSYLTLALSHEFTVLMRRIFILFYQMSSKFFYKFSH